MGFRKQITILVALGLLGVAVTHASMLTNVAIREGVDIALVWQGGSAQAVHIPVEEGCNVPHGADRLVVHIDNQLVDPRARTHELQVRRSRERPRRLPHGDASSDGSLTFEVPLDLAFDDRASDVTLTLFSDRGARGLDQLSVSSMTFVPSETVEVASVNRYPDLAWQGCPAPCYRRPPELWDVTAGEWRQALNVIEVDAAGGRRRVEDFQVGIHPERPASMIYLVDASGSILQEGSGDPSRLILEHFAAFPDAAYGGDRVRSLDRLAMVFFSDDVIGYYRGHPAGDPSATPPPTVIGDASRFFSPDALSPTWADFCSAIDDRDATPARMDDAWLSGAGSMLVGETDAGAATLSPWTDVCTSGRPPGDVLERYRAAVRRCHSDPSCRVKPAGTNVLPALRRAARDLDLLGQDATVSSQIRNNPQAVILISDGLDADFMPTDPRLRENRFRELRRDVLRGKRFFFVDIHSDLVLTRKILASLPGRRPLYDIVVAAIDEHVGDPEASLLLINALALGDDAGLRARVAPLFEGSSLEDLMTTAPALHHALRRVVLDRATLYKAVESALRERWAGPADAILAGKPIPETAPPAWIAAVARASASYGPAALKAAPAPGFVRKQLDRILGQTVDQFVELARRNDGLAISTRECVHAEPGGETLVGPACAFRKILDTLRGTLHVRYEPTHRRGIRKVDIQLTARGREILASRNLTGVKLDLRGPR
jgi:hypothetical protein